MISKAFKLHRFKLVHVTLLSFNVSTSSYDKPVRNGKKKKATAVMMVQSHYQNLNFDDHDGPQVDDDDDPTYLNIRTYDIPRTATVANNIYDQPRTGHLLNQVNNNNNNHLALASDSDYDYPKGLIPLSARLLLNASRKHLHHCDVDSLDGDQSPGMTTAALYLTVTHKINPIRDITVIIFTIREMLKMAKLSLYFVLNKNNENYMRERNFFSGDWSRLKANENQSFCPVSGARPVGRWPVSVR